jgi:A/G-specific adenine glycosylase
VKAAKKAKPTRQGRAFWIERIGPDGVVEVLMVTRPGKGMLGGMRALPDDGWSARGDGDGQAPLAGTWRSAGVVRHGFTHFDLELQLMVGEALSAAKIAGAHWWPRDDVENAGLPTVFAKAARLALAGTQDI